MELSKHFTEEDRERVVEYLNLVANHAKFTFETKEVIEYFKLLSHMQRVILPKIEAHVFELKEIQKAQKEKPDVRSRGTKRSGE